MSNHQRPYLWVEFQKTGKMRHLSHLEMARVFDRAVRRARIPVDYTEGYHPRARISFAPPLPVGAEGLRELCEIDLAGEMSPRDSGKALGKHLPRGLDLVSAQVLARGRRSPFANLSRAEYNISIEIIDSTTQQLQRAIEQFDQAEHVSVRRETKRQVHQIDIRPGTYQLELQQEDNRLCLYMTLGFGQQDLVKPAEVVSALGQMMGEGELRVGQLVRLGMYQV